MTRRLIQNLSGRLARQESAAARVSTRHATPPGWARPPKTGTQLLGVPTQIVQQAASLLLPMNSLARRIEQLRSDEAQAVIQRAPAVLDSGQGEVETLRELDVGVAENRLAQHPLLCARETEAWGRVEECGSDGTAKVRENLRAREAEEERTPPEWRQRFAAPREIGGVVRHHGVRAAFDGMRRHFIPEFDKSSLNPIAPHVFNEGGPHPVVQRRSQLLGQRRLDIVEMHSIEAAAGIFALDGCGPKDGRRAREFLTDGPDGEVGFFTRLGRRHPRVGDNHHHAERKNAARFRFHAPAFGDGRYERIIAKQPSPDFRKLGKNGRRICKMAPQQFKAGGKVVFFERADKKIHGFCAQRPALDAKSPMGSNPAAPVCVVRWGTEET